MTSKIKPNEIRLLGSRSHHRNFIDALKTGKPVACPIDPSVRSNTICQLDNIAVKLNRKLNWNPQKEQFINDPEANQMLSRPMRSPWHL